MIRKHVLATEILLVMFSFADALPAKLVDAAPDGFTISQILMISATPLQVYQRFVRDVGAWWAPGHTYSGIRATYRSMRGPAAAFASAGTRGLEFCT